MKTTVSRIVALSLALTTGLRAEGELGFLETFATASDREEALGELIPGTEDFYYYTALHRQNAGDFTEVEALLKPWVKRYGRTPRVREIQNRQALLRYGEDPGGSLEYIRREMGLNFNHRQEQLDEKPNLPTELEGGMISRAALTARALRNSKNLDRFEDAALDWILREGKVPLDGVRRRHLLSRLQFPDYERLPKLVAADLKSKESRGFGEFKIHGRMLREQLDELLGLRPELATNVNYVNAYLAKLAPGADVDWRRDREVKGAYLERLHEYAAGLEPSFNSLKAHILYRLLAHRMEGGEYPRDLFMEYVKLPRPVFYVNPKFLEAGENRRFAANLDADFRPVTGMPPVGADEPLVRAFLLEFFKKDKDYDELAKYLRENYLKPIFAEAKIVNGIGNQEKWYAMLSPADYEALRQRVDLEFVPENPAEFAVEDAVKLDLHVKNVRDLIVKVYEINALNYYRQENREINTDLNLDGLVANVEKSYEYGEAPLRRVRRSFSFDELKGRRGVWIVEFIGNGISSRAVVRKGNLELIAKTTSAGQWIRVLREDNGPAENPAVWLGERRFAPDRKGRIFIPFSNAPGRKAIVLTDGDFAARGFLQQEGESYRLEARFHVDRENLLAGRVTKVAVRPMLTVNGAPVDPGLLEEVILRISSTNLEGVVSTDEVPGFALKADRESVYEFRVPARLSRLEFTLEGKLRNLSAGSEERLASSQAFSLNQIDSSEYVADLFLTGFEGEDVLELLGKSGEPLADRPVHLELKHRDFSRTVNVSLRTDSRGRVTLGPLEGIDAVKANGGDFSAKRWSLPADRHNYAASLHGREGETLFVPYMGEAKSAERSEVALLELRGGAPARDRFDAVALENGFLKLAGLAAGDYELRLRREGRTVSLKVTEGARRDEFLLSRHRHLEVRDATPLQIASVDASGKEVRIVVANANDFTRVHVIATRFVPDYDLYGSLGAADGTEPLVIRRGSAESRYLSGRDIGEEYRYILERRSATKYPGNMLARPGLLLNPWSPRDTKTSVDEAMAGEEWDRAKPQAGAMASRAKKNGKSDGGRGGRQSFANLEFIVESAPVRLNLVPGDDGVVAFPREALGDRQHLQVVAVDPRNAVLRNAMLREPRSFPVRDTRLSKPIDPARHFAEQKRTSVLEEGEALEIGDIRSADLESYDDLAKVYAVFAALSGNATLAEFAFVLEWPELEAARKRELYSEYACHELNLFLARKDPAFFEEVVGPHVANKKDKTFLDDYFTGANLARFLEPWAHGRLNVLERILLARRVGGDEAASTARHVRDLYDLVPPNVETWNFRFRSALAGRALSADTGGSVRAATQSIVAVAGAAVTAEPGGGMAADAFAAPSAGRALKMMKAPAAPAMDALAAAAPAEKSADKEEAAKKKSERKSGARRGLEGAEEEQVLGEAVSFGFIGREATGLRDSQRQWYRAMAETREWAENNYYHLPITEQDADLIGANAFWRDYAAWDGEGAFYSENFTEATGSFAEMMCALAVLDLPFAAGEHEIEIEGGTYTLTAKSPMVVFHKEIEEAQVAVEKTPVLVSQNFFRHGDRYRQEGNERVEKYVTEEFLRGVLYGCQVVVTNPTSATQKLDLLLQVPEKAIPALHSEYTKSEHVRLAPFSTHQVEYYFYFPESSGDGNFEHYPVHVSKNEEQVAWADPFRFKVVDKLSRLDEASWDYVSQFASDREVLAYLKENNVDRLNLERIAWRAREKESFLRAVVELLSKRHVYENSIWSYGIHHGITPIARQFLMHAQGFVQHCGAYLDCELVTIDPVARRSYEHLEYRPLVNARAHRLGRENQILNDRFREQYLALMRILSCRAELEAVDRLAVASYLLLQDRIEEGLRWFAGVDREAVAAKMAFDYVEAYAAMYVEKPEAAAEIAARYADYPVDRWRERFARVTSQVAEIDGGKAEVLDPEDREQVQDTLADTEPFLDFEVEDGEVRLRYENVKAVTVNYYTMDLEFLFSSNPFVSKDTGRFSFIRPNASEERKLAAGRESVAFEIPDAFGSSNVLVEIMGEGRRVAKAHYANEIDLQLAENYGRLQVRDAASGAPLGKTYVKVYARFPGGETKFYKDGYTDLRGKFDYTSLNTGELEHAERLSLLVMSEEHGAEVREVGPPQR